MLNIKDMRMSYVTGENNKLMISGLINELLEAPTRQTYK